MSSLKYYAYDGVGVQNRQNFWYSQAVRIPAGADRIECAGQGGWDPKTFEIPDDVVAQVDQAFANVDLNLKDAGVKGWASVYRVNSYHVPLDESALGAMVRNFKKWCPEHHPIWTTVGVTALGDPRMKVEIEVVAYDQ